MRIGDIENERVENVFWDGALADFQRGVIKLCHMEATPLNGKQNAKYDD